MSVRSEKTANKLSPAEAMTAAITDAQPGDAHLGEGASYTTNTPENALHRTIVVSVRASLNELCLQRQKGTWAPSQEALRSILQSRCAPLEYYRTRGLEDSSPASNRVHTSVD